MGIKELWFGSVIDFGQQTQSEWPEKLSQQSTAKRSEAELES